MGGVFSCCSNGYEKADERIPFKNNKGSPVNLKGSNGANEEDFIIDPEIRAFLDNFTSDDDDGQQNDDEFENILNPAED